LRTLLSPHLSTLAKDIRIVPKSLNSGGLLSALSNSAFSIPLKIKRCEFLLLHLLHLEGVMLDDDAVVTCPHAVQYHLQVVVQNPTTIPEF